MIGNLRRRPNGDLTYPLAFNSWNWAFFHAKKHIKPAPLPQLSFKEKAFRVADGMAGLFTIIIILGGIISGFFTATEAGAMASLYAIILCCGVYRETKWSELPKILFECCQVNAVVLFLVATSSVFTWVLTYENLPKMLANTVFAITDNKFILLIVINVFLLIVGCLVLEHFIARRRSLNWINVAFFRLNAVVSAAFLIVTVVEVVFKGGFRLR